MNRIQSAVVPGPKGLPLLGSLPAFARDPLGFLEQMKRQYGDIVHYRFGGYPLYQFNHPDQIEEVLVTNWRAMHKDQIYRQLEPLMGKGLVTAEDETWKTHRKIIAPAFARKHIAGYADTMVRCAADWARGRRHGEELDVHAAMMQVAQDIVLETLFGADIDGEVDATQAAHCIDVVMDEFMVEARGRRRLLPKWIPTRGRRRANQAIDELDRLIFALIAARRRIGVGDDMLSRLIVAADDEGNTLNDAELRDEAVTMFVAGHETTALALTYTLILLADHPDVVSRLRAEVDAVLGDRPATAADYNALPYTVAVIKESMRVLPPVWAIGRENQEPVTIGGHRLEPGNQLLVSQWVLHHDARWFEEPDAFRPDRWLDEGFEKSLPRMAYIPFGGGPRVCIGNRFAMLEAVLVLATIQQHLGVRTYGRQPGKLLPSITLRPRDPVIGRILRRQSPMR